MPALRPPAKPVTMDLPPRTGQIAGETDVLVIGGGPAGIGAALAVRSDKTPKAVPVEEVQNELMRQGADLGREKPEESS